MISADDIEHEGNLREWLKNRPVEDLKVISGRAALRWLPRFSQDLKWRIFSDEVVLALLRAYSALHPFLAPSKVIVSPKLEQTQLPLAKVMKEQGLSSPASVSIIFASSAMRQAGSNTGISHAVSAVTAGWDRTLGNVADRMERDAFEAIRADAGLLEAGESHAKVALAPLWPENREPGWFKEDWITLTHTFQRMGQGSEVWVHWYQGIINGQPADEDLQHQIALIPDEIWEQGAKVVNAEVARILAQGRSRPLAEADFKYNQQTNAMEMVPFEEDLSALSDEALRARLATILTDLRDACMELARDIQLDKKQVPGSFRRDLNRYAREADRGPMDTRPGTLRRLGASLVRGAQNDDIRDPLTDYLCPKLDEIVQQHLALQAKYHAGMFNRMPPAENTVLDVTPEEADTRIGSALETITSDAWRDLPRVPDELPEIVEQQREALRNMAARIDLKPEGDERQKMIRVVEEGYVSLTATVSWFVVRTLEVIGDKTTGHKTWQSGTAVTVGVLGSLASIYSIMTSL